MTLTVATAQRNSTAGLHGCMKLLLDLLDSPAPNTLCVTATVSESVNFKWNCFDKCPMSHPCDQLKLSQSKIQ